MSLLLQVAGLKDKLAVVLSKTQNDDKLIAALRRELVAATGGKAGAGRSVHGSKHWDGLDKLTQSFLLAYGLSATGTLQQPCLLMIQPRGGM